MPLFDIDDFGNIVPIENPLKSNPRSAAVVNPRHASYGGSTRVDPTASGGSGGGASGGGASGGGGGGGGGSVSASGSASRNSWQPEDIQDIVNNSRAFVERWLRSSGKGATINPYALARVRSSSQGLGLRMLADSLAQGKTPDALGGDRFQDYIAGWFGQGAPVGYGQGVVEKMLRNLESWAGLGDETDPRAMTALLLKNSQNSNILPAIIAAARAGNAAPMFRSQVANILQDKFAADELEMRSDLESNWWKYLRQMYGG